MPACAGQGGGGLGRPVPACAGPGGGGLGRSGPACAGQGAGAGGGAAPAPACAGTGRAAPRTRPGGSRGRPAGRRTRAAARCPPAAAAAPTPCTPLPSLRRFRPGASGGRAARPACGTLPTRQTHGCPAGRRSRSSPLPAARGRGAPPTAPAATSNWQSSLLFCLAGLEVHTGCESKTMSCLRAACVLGAEGMAGSGARMQGAAPRAADTTAPCAAAALALPAAAASAARPKLASSAAARKGSTASSDPTSPPSSARLSPSSMPSALCVTSSASKRSTMHTCAAAALHWVTLAHAAVHIGALGKILELWGICKNIY